VPPELSTLSLHDALPISLDSVRSSLGPPAVVGLAGAGTVPGVVTPTPETAPETTATNFVSPAASMPLQTASVALPAASLPPGGRSEEHTSELQSVSSSYA